jgi:alkylation response protein AidB-like acyl-CoA dehydrogenase
VDFDLSDDQEALVSAAAALLESRATIEQVRKVAGAGAGAGAGAETGTEADAEGGAGNPGHIDRNLWAQMAEQGWLAVERPEASGGLGMGFVEVAVLCEQVGRHLAPVPFAGTVLALEAIASVSGEGSAQSAGRSELVERLSSGEAIGAVAWTRRPGQVVAERSDGAGAGAENGPDNGWVVTGRPDPVVFGPVADVVIVPAEISGSRGSRELFLVESPPDTSRKSQPAMDLTRSLGWLELDATPASLLAGPGAFSRLADRAAVAISAEMLGAAQRVLDMTVQYAKDRVQFGRPIGSFQAVKHRCADMLVDVEGMRSAVYYAAWCIAADSPDASSAASAAKIWCSEAAARVMASGLQVHGGIGFTWEHDMHLYVKRSQLDQVSFGDTSWHHDRLADMLRALAEAGLPVM